MMTFYANSLTSRKTRWFVCLAVLALFLSPATKVKAEIYASIPIDYPNAWYTFAYDINNHGQIVGEYHPGISGNPRANSGFVRENGNYSPIDFPNAGGTAARGINDHGQIVGYYNDGNWHGFVLENGNYNPIDFPNAWNTFAHDINDHGQIVGLYYNSRGGPAHGFLLENGSFTTIDFPNADWTEAHGINDDGKIVGFYVDGSGTHGFVRENGNYSSIDFPNALATWAGGINNHGHIVGHYFDTHSAGFVLENGKFSIIELHNGDSIGARGINDHGQIVGVHSSGVLAIPVSELPQVNLQVRAEPNPATVGEPFEIRVDLVSLGVPFMGQFGITLIKVNNDTVIRELQRSQERDIGGAGYTKKNIRLRSTKELRNLPAAVMFVVVLYDVATGAVAGDGSVVVNIDNDPDPTEIATLEALAEEYVNGLRAGAVSAAPPRPTPEGKLTTTWGAIKQR